MNDLKEDIHQHTRLLISIQDNLQNLCTWFVGTVA